MILLWGAVTAYAITAIAIACVVEYHTTRASTEAGEPPVMAGVGIVVGFTWPVLVVITPILAPILFAAWLGEKKGKRP